MLIAPVTRLRRRLSVETEELKSPSGVTTPTKKRGGRLAAKPQLDLIDENGNSIFVHIKKVSFSILPVPQCFQHI